MEQSLRNLQKLLNQEIIINNYEKDFNSIINVDNFNERYKNILKILGRMNFKDIRKNINYKDDILIKILIKIF